MILCDIFSFFEKEFLENGGKFYGLNDILVVRGLRMAWLLVTG